MRFRARASDPLQRRQVHIAKRRERRHIRARSDPRAQRVIGLGEGAEWHRKLDLGDILHHQSVDARLYGWDGDAGVAGLIAIQQRANIGGDALDHANMKTRGHLPRKAGAQGMELLGGTIGCRIMLDM